MTVDALQYAPNKVQAFAEVARILRPGGRFAFVAFELDPSRRGPDSAFGTIRLVTIGRCSNRPASKC